MAPPASRATAKAGTSTRPLKAVLVVEVESSGERLVITQIRSAIGTKPKHRATLRALGLRGIGRQNLLPDRREIRGMLAQVAHLVRVEVASAPSDKEQSQ